MTKPLSLFDLDDCGIGSNSLKSNDELRTPSYIYESFGLIDLDPCAGDLTRIGKINLNINRGEDGLLLPWFGFVYCNPPFSKKQPWIDRMISHNNGILLLPERGSAPWCNPILMHTYEGAYFTMGKKINFDGGSSSSNVGQYLFPFGEDAYNRLIKSGLPGRMSKVVQITTRQESKIKF